MTTKKQAAAEARRHDANETPESATPTDRPECFVIMPISDPDGYPAGHFKRVYEHIIKPACHLAGFVAIRADDVVSTNHIVLDVVRRVIEAPMAIADLSAKNANVFYELGIRQAFNKPVTLVKDSLTSRVFDIQPLRDVEYDTTLRVDTVAEAVDTVSRAIRMTHEASTDDRRTDVNSIVQLLGIQPASLPKTEVSQDTGVILQAIQGLSQTVSAMRAVDPLAGASSASEAERARASNRYILRSVGRAAFPPAVGGLAEVLASGRAGWVTDGDGRVLVSGLRVSHPSYGAGTVQSAGPDEGVAVLFDQPEVGVVFFHNTYELQAPDSSRRD